MKFSKEERSHSNVFYRQLYAVWNHMYQRCYNKKNKSYHTYGAKGVKTDKKWLTFDGFAQCLFIYTQNGSISTCIKLIQITVAYSYFLS